MIVREIDRKIEAYTEDIQSWIVLDPISLTYKLKEDAPIEIQKKYHYIQDHSKQDHEE